VGAGGLVMRGVCRDWSERDRREGERRVRKRAEKKKRRNLPKDQHQPNGRRKPAPEVRVGQQSRARGPSVESSGAFG